MDRPDKDSIQKATERVMKRLPLKKLRQIPKYKNMSKKQYLRLIKSAETLALIILEVFTREK